MAEGKLEKSMDAGETRRSAKTLAPISYTQLGSYICHMLFAERLGGCLMFFNLCTNLHFRLEIFKRGKKVLRKKV